MKRYPKPDVDHVLVEECQVRSIELLRENLTPAGILAARRTTRAAYRGYCAIFGRDASICAIGMAVSGDPGLRKGALAGLSTLAAHQARNGHRPRLRAMHVPTLGRPGAIGRRFRLARPWWSGLPPG